MTAPPTIPLYELVKRQISDAVLEGVWRGGDVLPGEKALSDQYGVAVGTIRRALADLTAEGLLTRRRRTGTVVTGRMPQHSMRFFFQYFRLHRADGRLVRSVAQVLALGRGAATEAEAAALGLPAGSGMIRIKRLRSVAGTPIMHETMVIPADRAPGFPQHAKDMPELLYVHLLEHCDIRISAVRERVSAAAASAEDRSLLARPDLAAVLVIDACGYDQSDRPCILGGHRAVTDGFSYVNEIR